MSSSPKPHQQSEPVKPNSDPKTQEKNQELEKQEAINKTDVKDQEAEAEAAEEEETECGFCLFMKGGGCKDTFISWENCVEEAEKNKEEIVEKCFEATSALKKCMEAHSDYYAPLLKAEEDFDEDEVEPKEGDGEETENKGKEESLSELKN